MSRVLVKLRLLPASPETDLDELERVLKERIKPVRLEREPIGFGLVALHVFTLVSDAAGEVERLESKLKQLKGCGEVEVMELSRVWEG